MQRQLASAVILVSLLMLAACSNVLPEWLGAEEDKVRLEGERLSVLDPAMDYAPEKSIQHIEVKVPPPLINGAWQGRSMTENGTVIDHPALPGDLSQSYQFKGGEAPANNLPLKTLPIIVEGKIIYIDGGGNIIALSADNITQLLWRVDSGLDKDKILPGGGLSYDRGVVYASISGGTMVAVEASTGKLLWRRALGSPLRSAPFAKDGQVYVVSITNATYALDVKDGATLWVHNGLPATTTSMGAAAPIGWGQGEDAVVIVPYSSGELYALEVKTGRPRWTSNLTMQQRRGSSFFTLADISVTPTLDGDAIFVSGQAGLLLALDVRSGRTLWQVQAAARSGIWVAGDLIYFITTDNVLIGMVKYTGQIRWSVALPQYKEGNTKKGFLAWNGPVLAGGRLIISNAEGELRTVSPKDGSTLDRFDLRAPSFTSPVVAGEVAYFLMGDGSLMARK